MNKCEQVASHYYPMSLAGVGWGFPQVNKSEQVSGLGHQHGVPAQRRGCDQDQGFPYGEVKYIVGNSHMGTPPSADIW